MQIAPPFEHKTIRQWQDVLGVVILDPDGFNRKDPLLYDRLWTLEQFNERAMLCTLMIVPGGAFQRAKHDALGIRH